MLSTCLWDVLVLVLVLFSLAPPALTFSRGANKASCRDMIPGHIRAQPQDPKLRHVTLTTSAASYLPGQLVTVTVRSSRDFMGFLLQARTVEGTTTGHEAKTGPGSGTRVRSTSLGPALVGGGSWTFTPPGTHTLRCLSDGDTLTHSDKQLKRNLSFVWKAPDAPMGDVKFYITVVQSYFVYWAGIESAVVHDGSRSPRSPASSYGSEQTQMRVTAPTLEMDTSANPSDNRRSHPATLRPLQTETYAARGVHSGGTEVGGLGIQTETHESSPVPGEDPLITAPLSSAEGQETEATTRTQKTLTTTKTTRTSYSFHNQDPPTSMSQNTSQVFPFYQDFTLRSSSPNTPSPISQTRPPQPDQTLSITPKPQTSPHQHHLQTAKPPERTSPSISPQTQTEGQVDFLQTNQSQPDPPSTPNALGVSSQPSSQTQSQAFTSRQKQLQSSAPPRSINPPQSTSSSDSTYTLEQAKIKTTGPTVASSSSSTTSFPVSTHLPPPRSSSLPPVHQRSTAPQSSTVVSKQTSSTRASSPSPPTPFASEKHAKTLPALTALPSPAPISIPSIQPVLDSTAGPSSTTSSTVSPASMDPSSSSSLSTSTPYSSSLVSSWSTSPHPEPSPAPRRSLNLLTPTSPPEPQKLTQGQGLLIQSHVALSDPDPNPTLKAGFNPNPEPHPNLVVLKPNPPKADMKPPPGTTPKEGKYPDKPRHSVWELGMLLGCSAGLGTVLVVGVRYVYRQTCGKRTGVTLNDRERESGGRGDRGLIHVQECGDLVRVRRIRENSFVLLAEYDILATPGD